MSHEILSDLNFQVYFLRLTWIERNETQTDGLTKEK